MSPPRTVSLSIPRAAVRISERHGIARAALLGPPSISEEELSEEVVDAQRITWDAFRAFNARLEAAWVGRGGLQRFARELCDELPETRAYARTIVSARQLLELMVSFGRWAQPALETRSSALPDGRLELEVRIPPHLEDDPVFFRLVAHTVAESPRLLKLAPAEVELSLAPRVAQMRFRVATPLPPPAPAPDASGEVARITLARIVELQEEIRALRHAAIGALDLAARSEVLAQRWSLTPRQREVLQALAAGSSNREIAAALGGSERTVELHVTAILKRSGMGTRARLAANFWTAGD